MTTLIWRAAKAINRDPLKELGIEGDLLPETAVFVLEMENPDFAEQVKGQAWAAKKVEQYRLENLWTQARRGTYAGARVGVERVVLSNLPPTTLSKVNLYGKP